MRVPLDNLAEWKHLAYRELRKTLDRRSFIREGLSALTGAAMAGTLLKAFSGGRAFADPAPIDSSHAVKTGTFFIPRLKFDVLSGPCIWNVYPHADVILRQSLARLTNINVSQEPVVVNLADFNSLRHYPFVFATDELHFEPVTDEPHALIARAGHPLAARSGLQLEELARHGGQMPAQVNGQANYSVQPGANGDGGAWQ